MKNIFILLFAIALIGCKTEEEKAQSFFERGNEYLEQQNISAAELEFKNAVKLNPFHTRALFGIATIYEMKKRWGEMESTLIDVLDKDPGYLDARIKLTNLYLGQNRIDKALSHSEKLIEQAPENKIAVTLRAAVLFKIDDKAAARELLQKVLTQSPNYIDAVVLNAHDLMSQGDVDSAVTQLEGALQKNPESIVLNIVLLQALDAAQNVERSVAVYQNLMQLYPDNRNIPLSLARLYYRNGKASDAIALLEDQASVKSDTEFLFKALEITNDLNGLQAAEDLTKTYIKQFPNLLRLKFALADIYVKRDKLNLALDQLNTVWGASSDTKLLIEAGLRKARLEMIANDLDQAGQTLVRLESLNASDPGVVVLKADYLMSQGDESAAIRVLRAALRQYPSSGDIAATLAKAHERQGDWGLANEYYTTAIRSPGGIAYAEAYAEYLVNRNELVKAEQLLGQMLRLGESSKKAYRLLAQIKLSQGEWQEVEELADRIEADMGEGPETAYIRGLAASGREDFAAAAEAMERLQSMAPNSVRSMVLLVDAYLRAGKRAEAEDFLNRVIATDPQSFYGYFLRGNLHGYYREWQAAERDYKVALSHNPESEEAYDALARMYLRAGKMKDAAKILEEGIAQLPESIKLTALRAELFRREGDLDAAIALYRNLQKKRASVDVVANNLAALLLSDPSEAAVQEALSLVKSFRQSSIPQYLDTLGWAYVLSGEYVDGLSLLRRAAEALPNEGEIRYHLAEGYFRSGEPVLASQAIIEALALASPQDAWYANATALQQKIEASE